MSDSSTEPDLAKGLRIQDELVVQINVESAWIGDTSPIRRLKREGVGLKDTRAD
jgi:hypothetical protein